jgi:hypothetical protein
VLTSYSEHRQRKENYVKHLEQDIIRLREMISSVETEVSTFQQENAVIKTTLSKRNVPTSAAPPTNFDFQFSQKGTPPAHSAEYDPAQRQPPAQASPQGYLEHSQSPRQNDQFNLQSNASKSAISISFDDIIGASCLHVSPANSFETPVTLNSPDIFSFPLDALAISKPESAQESFNASSKSTSSNPPTQLYHSTHPGLDNMPKQPDTSSVAINFILA